MGTTRPIIEVPETRDYAVKIRHEGITAGWEQWYFVMSDAHWDAPECYLKLLHEHLSEAKDRNALSSMPATSKRLSPVPATRVAAKERCARNTSGSTTSTGLWKAALTNLAHT